MLNIKNPRAHQLAVEVAEAAGETLTDAVIHSLEERRDRLKPKSKGIDMGKVQALLAEIRPLLSDSFRNDPDPTAYLYDPETGEPI